jgi:hypothetical protein
MNKNTLEKKKVTFSGGRKNNVPIIFFLFGCERQPRHQPEQFHVDAATGDTVAAGTLSATDGKFLVTGGGEGGPKHQSKELPQSLMSTLVDCYSLHFWYLRCVCIGCVCEENDTKK